MKWCIALALATAAPLGLAQASSYPSKPVKVIVPFTPGGGSDTAARFFGEKLGDMLGQPFLVENKPGGVSGSLGTIAVKNAPADGYTILVGSSSPMVVNPITIKDPGYDALKDFKPVAGLTKNTTAIVVPANSKWKTFGELVKDAKANPKLNVATASAGFALAATWLGSTAGFDFTHVPYKGLNQVLTDLGGGHLDWSIVDLAGATPMLQAGKIRALAVTDERRHPSFPDVPALVEVGYPEYVYNTWTSFHVRADTPADVTSKLATALQKILATDAAKEYVRRQGTELLPLAPAAMLKFQHQEVERFQKVADVAGMKKN
ncbi:MAG: tripartite tricarboxylate transporter substrate binding protein [Gemmatimonadaceae bacterium]|nr:tripartite tricarboxylate transporter substrate binding protein [Gemmatimonadaceae bacterium]